MINFCSGDVDADAAHRWIAPFLSQFSKVEFVSFVSIFREHYERGGKTLFIPYDFRLNELGNERVVRQLSLVLSE